MNENLISATGGAAEEQETELDELDIEAFVGLECKPRAKHYIIRIDKKPYVIDKSVLTALEVLHIAGKNPPEKFRIWQIISGESGRQHDKLFVFHFNDQITAGVFNGKPFASNSAELLAAFPSAPPLGATALYDAVIAGLRRVSLGQRDKRALVLISDGDDNASEATRSDMLAFARQTNVAIYAIALAGSTRDKRGEDILKQLCADSGGVAYFARSSSDVERLLSNIGNDLRQQYILGFVPSNVAGRHTARRLRVTVSSPGLSQLTVRTRTFYLPPQSQ